jgi:hypothetical protein
VLQNTQARAQEILTSKTQKEFWARGSLWTVQISFNMADISTKGRRHEEGNFELKRKWGLGSHDHLSKLGCQEKNNLGHYLL